MHRNRITGSHWIIALVYFKCDIYKRKECSYHASVRHTDTEFHARPMIIVKVT